MTRLLAARSELPYGAREQPRSGRADAVSRVARPTAAWPPPEQAPARLGGRRLVRAGIVLEPEPVAGGKGTLFRHGKRVL